MDTQPEITEEHRQKMKNLQGSIEKKAEEVHQTIEAQENTKEKAKNMFAEIAEKANNK
jgi:hypothetical protein